MKRFSFFQAVVVVVVVGGGVVLLQPDDDRRHVVSTIVTFSFLFFVCATFRFAPLFFSSTSNSFYGSLKNWTTTFGHGIRIVF